MPKLEVLPSLMPHEWEVYRDGRYLGYIQQEPSGLWSTSQDKYLGNRSTLGIASKDRAVAQLVKDDEADQRAASRQAVARR